jgi:polyisoprenoid-binding protein YceI
MRVFCLALLLAAPLARADWDLEPEQSRISFVSVKRGEIATVQHFEQLSGTIDGGGKVRLLVPFSGLDSGLALQDERMRQALFQTDRYSEATISAQLDLSQWQELAVGESRQAALDLELDLHGQRRQLNAEVLVSRLGEEKLQVVTLEPVLLKAVDYDLTEGLERLQQIAGLPSITPEVPVFAVLNFRQQP